MRARTISMLALVALTAAACGGGATSGGDPAEGLVGAWVLVDATPSIDVPTGARVTLTVEDDDGALRAGGRAACNSYGGTLDAADGRWRLDQLSWTEMGCEQPLMAVEAAYLDALVAIDAWTVDDAGLVLTGGGVELRFGALAPVEPAALVGTTWVLDGLLSGTGDDGAITSPMAGVEPATLRLDEDGTFELFTGCRDFAGDWTTSGDLVVLPSWGETADSRGVGADGGLDCAAAAEAQERDVLDVLESEFTPALAERRLTVRRGDVGLSFRASDAG